MAKKLTKTAKKKKDSEYPTLDKMLPRGKAKFHYAKKITEEMVLTHPNTLFVFGDNTIRTGYGGQTAVMRGKSNAFGITTKRAPDSFMKGDLADLNDMLKDMHKLMDRVRHADTNIIWPKDGIGTGRAELEEKAPHLLKLLKAFEKALKTSVKRSEL